MTKSIYIAFNNEDKSFHDAIMEQFIGLIKTNKVLFEKVIAGDEREDIKEKVKNLDCILPILSPKFFNDETINYVLTLNRKDGSKLIPIYAKDFNLESYPDMEPYLDSVIPDNDTSIIKAALDLKNTEAVYVDIMKKIANKLNVEIEFSDVNIEDNRRFLYLAIVCFLAGLGSSIYIFSITSSWYLFSVVLALFMTLTIWSSSKYLSNKL